MKKQKSIIHVILLLFLISMPSSLDAQILRCPPDSSPLSNIEYKTHNLSKITTTLDIAIPVAFHIIHTTGGTGNISDAVIEDQIDVLNSAYSGAGISFYLLSIDRTANNNWFYNLEHRLSPPYQIEYDVKNALAIDPKYVLNIYTADIGYLGFARFPWDYNENHYMHGVVLRYTTLPGGGANDNGYDYDDGDTAVHEIGHYLGLLHTYGDDSTCSSDADGVLDTPRDYYNVGDTVIFQCTTGRNTCLNHPGDDPIHNYMDGTDDACAYEFTSGQINRMATIVGNEKPSLGTRLYVPTDEYPTITSAITAASSGQKVVVAPGTYAGSIYMKAGVEVEGAGTGSTIFSYRVYFDNDNGAKLSKVRVNDKITITNSDNVEFYDVISAGNSYYMDITGSSNGYIQELTCTATRFSGVYQHNASDIDYEWCEITNKYFGIEMTTSSTADIWGSYFCSNNIDISATSYASAEAYSCTFSSSTVEGSLAGDVYWQNQGGWQYCDLASIFLPHDKADVADAFTNEDIDGDEFRRVMQNYNQLMKNLNGDKNNDRILNFDKYTNEITDVTQQLKTFLGYYTESKYSPTVLNVLGGLLRIQKKYDELKILINDLVADKEHSILKPYASNLLVINEIKKNNYREAVELYEGLIKTYHEHELAIEWMFAEGMLYKYHLNETEQADEIFKEIVSLYPDHRTTQSALAELEEDGEWIKEEVKEEETKNKFTTSCYPNPFNPTTTIAVSLPKQDDIKLIVFDVLGREVIKLADGNFEAGKHDFKFNAANLPSGIYFYNIRTSGQSITKKMMLLK